MCTFSCQRHHALLAALLYREIERVCPADCRRLTERVVTDYGLDRGRIARENTLKMGDSLDIHNYKAYKSLRTTDDEFVEEVLSYGPDLTTEVRRCCWIDVWRQYGLLEYGKRYCLYCDKAMMRGYNPAVTLEIPALMERDGSPVCRFVWPGVTLCPERVAAKKEQLQGRFVMSWGQLTDHLLHCAKQSLNSEEPGLGNVVAARALRAFAEIENSRPYEKSGFINDSGDR